MKYIKITTKYGVNSMRHDFLKIKEDDSYFAIKKHIFQNSVYWFVSKGDNYSAPSPMEHIIDNNGKEFNEAYGELINFIKQ